MGGPLIVVPVSSSAAWRGCTETGVMAGDATAPDDYDRACAVDGPAGVITVGEDGAQALVLADEPATTCFLPEHRTFLRWLAADSETGLKTAAGAVLSDPATAWEECGTWSSDGPAVLMDSAEAGSAPDTDPSGDAMPSRGSGRAARRSLEGAGRPHRSGRGDRGRTGPVAPRRILNVQPCFGRALSLPARSGAGRGRR